MPIIPLEIPETQKTITRPIVMEVVKQFSASIGLPTNLLIQFAGDAASIAQTQSTIDREKEPNTFNHNQQYIISVEEDFNDDKSLSTVVNRPDNIVFFQDKKLGVSMKPAYQRADVTINVTYRTQDKAQAQLWVNTVKRKVGRGRDDQLHDFQYHYPIPAALIYMLCVIYDLREANQGYNEDIGKWFRDCFSEKMTVIDNQAGKHPTFVIRENQTRVLGYYEFTHDVPQFEKSGDAGAWMVSFTYKFSYDKCQQVVLQYPLMIHNQIIPGQFRDDSVYLPYDPDQIISEASMSTDVMDFFNRYKNAKNPWAQRPGLPIPYFDDWLPDIEPANTQNILRLLIGVNPADRKEVIDLSQLGNWRFSAVSRAYMKDQPQTLTQLYENVFKIDLHRGYQLTNNADLLVDNDLKVTYDPQMDEREYYHLTVGILTNLDMLSAAAKARLCKHGAFTIKLLKTLDPNIVNASTFVNGLNRGLLPKLNPDGTISSNDLKRATEWISDHFFIEKIDSQYSWYLVGQFLVSASRKE